MVPKVSIIIATFNSGKTLRESLDSVTNQNFNEWECIVVDGMSKDDTLTIVKEFANRDQRFRYVSEPDKGIYDALNKGVTMSKGEWIYVLGSDDCLLPDGLSILLETASKNKDAVLSYGDIYAVFSDGNKRYVSARDADIIRTRMCASHQAMITKRDKMIACGCFDLKYRIRADYNLTQLLYLSGGKFVRTKKPIAKVLQTGISSKVNIKEDMERYYINRTNNSCRFPFVHFLLVEIKVILRKVIIDRILYSNKTR